MNTAIEQHPDAVDTSAVQIRLRRCEQLTVEEWDAWARFQEQDRALESPYFRPEFTRAVAAERHDVEIAVLRRGGQIAGFFPFQRRGRSVAGPVGGRISDYQGIIAPPGQRWDAAVLIRECGLRAWDFDHVPCTQEAFQSYHRATDLSPYLDLAEGFEAYRDSLRKSGADELKQTLRKARKLDREVGRLRFEEDSKDPRMLATLLRWKSEQYRRTRATDVFAHRWTVRVLERIAQEQACCFAGTLSVLLAGERPVAMHMGMRSRGVLHWWFPAYDPQFGDYSPGRVLLAELARAAHLLAVQKIDLGRGVAPYKARAMSGAVAVAEGSVDLRPLARSLRERWRATREWVRSSPLHGPVRVPGRVIYRLGEWLALK